MKHIHLKMSRFLKHSYQKLTRGFSDEDIWNLDVTIAKFILPRLKEYKDTIWSTSGNYDTASDAYYKEVTEIIEGLSIMVTDDYYTPNAETNKKINNALNLLMKNFRGLWY